MTLDHLVERYGRVAGIIFAHDFDEHIAEQEHQVSQTEVAAVLALAPEFYDNEEGEDRSAPAVMVGPSGMCRMLKIPIAPTETWEVWVVLTAYDANAGDIAMYEEDRSRA